MKTPPAPTYRAHTVRDITVDWLEGEGVALLLLDFDNCLVEYGRPYPYPSINDYLRGLKRAEGITCWIVSNTYEPSRVRAVAEEHDMNFVIPGLRIDRWKPSAWCLVHAMEQTGIASTATLMVGDQLSDITAAQKAGCRSVLVDPLSQKMNPFARWFKQPKQEHQRNELIRSGRMPAYLSSTTPR